ncbi:MAG TPA: hypothetical protein VIK51_15480 [Vicinamibacteria bacterium]
MDLATLGVLLVVSGLAGLWAGPPARTVSAPPTLAGQLRATHWLMLLMGVGLIAHRLLPFRGADDLALQEVILGPLITLAGVLGSSLHWRKSAATENMWALRSRVGFALYVAIGVFATLHGITRLRN